MNAEEYLQGLMEAYGHLGSADMRRHQLMRRGRAAVAQAICDVLPPLSAHEWELVREYRMIAAIREYKNRNKRRRLGLLMCKIDEAREPRWCSVASVHGEKGAD
jgi:hypothetical protein